MDRSIKLYVELSEAVKALIEPMHVSRIEADGNFGWIELPSLLAQVIESVTPSGSVGGGGTSGSTESRPNLNLAALDVQLQIERMCDHWLTWLDLKTRRDGSADDLQQILGMAATISDGNLADLVKEVRHLRTVAAIVTGWESKPLVPNVVCPVCTVRGSIRFRPDERSALCTECETTWNGPALDEAFANTA